LKPVSSWGRLSALPHHAQPISAPQDLKAIAKPARKGLAYGMGRSYGDSCLNPHGTLWQMADFDNIISFDAQSGKLVCEAGMLLRDIQRLFAPRGFMLPVTPGTQMVTVGGAIANDVHGKNHHKRGSFGDHVLSLSLKRTDGKTRICTPTKNTDWLNATIGGLGLTGVITQAELQLMPVPSPYLETQTIGFDNLAQFFELSDASEADWEYTVSWIDCLNKDGRGVFMRANHATVPEGAKLPKLKKGTLSVPLTPPLSLVNRLSLKPFNVAYYQAQMRKANKNDGKALSHYQPFFYPLDGIKDWNRIYGPHGFYQYQSVVPRKGGEAAVKAMLRAIANSGQGSFLAVLKTFGESQSAGMLSFAQAGVTLALDFPNLGAPTLALMAELDAIVSASGGRLYPAKDARMGAELFAKGYPRLKEFLPYRDKNISSAMSLRLLGS